jgi:hypothetical protein
MSGNLIVQNRESGIDICYLHAVEISCVVRARDVYKRDMDIVNMNECMNADDLDFEVCRLLRQLFARIRHVQTPHFHTNLLLPTRQDLNNIPLHNTPPVL